MDNNCEKHTLGNVSAPPVCEICNRIIFEVSFVIDGLRVCECCLDYAFNEDLTISPNMINSKLPDYPIPFNEAISKNNKVI